MKFFISYTSSDRDWAQWIGWQLKEAGHEPFVHEWEIGAGQNIPRWMEDRLKEADRLIGVFSNAYCEALYSQSERWAAYWQDPAGRTGFLVPIEVREVSEWPPFVKPLRRLSLRGKDESVASKELITFLEPPKPPSEKPAFPGTTAETPSIAAKFSQGSEPIGAIPPSFPAALSTSGKPALPTSPRTPDLTTNIRCIDDHEPNPQIFGRDNEVEAIVKAIFEGTTVLVAGGPGVGKTAVATAALYDPRVVARFGRQRVFASLEAATEPRAILAKLVETIGLPPIGDEVSLLHTLESHVAQQQCVAILDNAETVFDSDRTNAERLLTLVARLKGLSLIVTIRGVPPSIPGATRIDDLPKLTMENARMAFLAIAGDEFRDDADLQHLLDALDGHALSIHLIAAQAVGSPSLRGIRESWDEAHAEILRISGEEGRLTSVRASLALSLESRRMRSTPLARRLVSTLAFLPGGLAERQVRYFLGEKGTLTALKASEAIICLHQLRLVERRPDHRLRMLTPLRESIKIDYGPLLADQMRMIKYFLEVARQGESIGTSVWPRAREEVESEADNLDSICELAITSGISDHLLDPAIYGLSKFYMTSGRGTVTSLVRIVSRLRTHPASKRLTRFLFALGRVAAFRSERDSARKLIKEALALDRKLNDKAGEINCLQLLGQLAIDNSEVDSARAYHTEALNISRRINNRLGEGNNLAEIASVALVMGDLVQAEKLNGEALEVFRKIGNQAGMAVCTRHQAAIAIWRREYDAARNLLNEASVISNRIGSVRGEARCLLMFGNIERRCFGFAKAKERFEGAQVLYRRVSSVAGEAEATIRLGQCEVASGAPQVGLANIENGFRLYFRSVAEGDRAAAGWKAMYEALTNKEADASRASRAEARLAWRAVSRLDLIDDWLDEQS